MLRVFSFNDKQLVIYVSKPTPQKVNMIEIK